MNVCERISHVANLGGWRGHSQAELYLKFSVLNTLIYFISIEYTGLKAINNPIIFLTVFHKIMHFETKINTGKTTA